MVPYTNHFDLVGFSDADYAGNRVDRKSTSGASFFLRKSLVSSHSKKQDCTTLSTAESEYVATGHCCTQLLWMATQLSITNLFPCYVTILVPLS